jgi:hypothetical protein
MTKPSDKEVEEFMKGLDFEWRQPGDGDSSCYWFNKADPSNWITNDQAAFFYQAQKEAVAAADRRTLKIIGGLLNGDDNKVQVARGYIHNKLRVYARHDKYIKDMYEQTER